MLEIGTSGSMSGEGKRGVAAWPKLPRLSSTLYQNACRERRRARPWPEERSMPKHPAFKRTGVVTVIVARDASMHPARLSASQPVSIERTPR